MIRRGLFLILTPMLLASLSAQAPYQPDPKAWKLQVLTPMGGWTTSTSLDLSMKVVDPRDPEPPKTRGPVDPDSPDADTVSEEGVTRQANEPWDDYWARVQVARERNKWRDRKLEVWFNGAKRVESIRVGYDFNLHLDLQDGENRLEIRQPDSHQGLVRTIFASAGKQRLVVRLVDPESQDTGFAWWWGGLQVVEPDGTESIGEEPTPSGGKNHGTSYTHPAPQPGTYTVRWFDSRAGVDGYGYDQYYEGEEVRPRTVFIEVLLDPGTDREKRWRFQRLIVPGTKRATMGSFDVED